MDNQLLQKIGRIIVVLAAICILIFIGSFVLHSIFSILMLIIQFILGVIVVGALYVAWLVLSSRKKK